MPPMRSLPLLAVALSACGGMVDPSTVEQESGACIELEGRRFESIDDKECGLVPPGHPPALCKWSVSFASRDEASSHFQWFYSDVGSTGQIVCDGSAITSVINPHQVTASYDPATNQLTWEDVTYAPVQ